MANRLCLGWAPCISRASAAVLLNTHDQQAYILHEERLQLTVMSVLRNERKCI